MKTAELRQLLLSGLVIPACPLPLNHDRSWSPRHQTALTRYYLESGVGGIAVGVHSTQFAIRDPNIGLYEPVLDSVSTEIELANTGSVVKVAGVCGDTQTAIAEAEAAMRMGYDCGLLSMTALANESEARILEHCAELANVIPVFGFYLQPAVGGRVLSFQFWRKFAEIPNVVAIKIAPFNRYQTLDVVRAVIESGRDDIALYTGNDDNIIVDLLTPFVGTVNGSPRRRFIDGGLLGQWGVWTSAAVRMLDQIKAFRNRMGDTESPQSQFDHWLEMNTALTDANAAVFDAANQFAGCIPGIMEVLRRNGLAPSNQCLEPAEILSPGQSEELDRVTHAYPQLLDNEFVSDNLARWLSE